MKKIISLIMALGLIICSAFSVSASEVTYSGNSGNFVFAPGSEYSPTDLFTNFKGVMPGDSITQDITVKNQADNKVKVKIYMRSLGAHTDSVDFLSKLKLRVQKSDQNDMAYMFDAAANETAGLTDWVCLGTLYSGGVVNLNVILDVPTELDNTYSEQIGYLDWEFMVEEFPIEDTDPKPPKTSDDSHLMLWIVLLTGSASILVILLFKRKKSCN